MEPKPRVHEWLCSKGPGTVKDPAHACTPIHQAVYQPVEPDPHDEHSWADGTADPRGCEACAARERDGSYTDDYV